MSSAQIGLALYALLDICLVIYIGQLRHKVDMLKSYIDDIESHNSTI